MIGTFHEKQRIRFLSKQNFTANAGGQKNEGKRIGETGTLAAPHNNLFPILLPSFFCPIFLESGSGSGICKARAETCFENIC
jgi:hypothetical protein